MALQYTQSELYEIIDGNVHGKFAQVQDRQITSNRAVRYVMGDVDLRSTKRASALSPNLFADVYDYTAPSDLKAHKIIDIRKQVNRSSFDEWTLVDEADFDKYKGVIDQLIAVEDGNINKILRIDGIEGTDSIVINNCDSLTANGTWSADGAEASNLTLDTDNYISGGGALNFDAAAGGATMYVENSDMTSLDLSTYEDIGSVFVWVYIPDYSDAEGDTVTNFILRIGSSSANYDSVTVTTNNEGLTFYDGWNLLRFDLNGASATGTPDYSAINYLRLTVTKSTSLAADTDWRVDQFTIRKGDIYDVVYYSKYGWQNSSGTYIEESSATTDLVVADTEEIEGIAFKASEFASQELKEYGDVNYFKQEYEQWKARYKSNYRSEALEIHTQYYRTRKRRSGFRRTRQ